LRTAGKKGRGGIPWSKEKKGFKSLDNQKVILFFGSKRAVLRKGKGEGGPQIRREPTKISLEAPCENGKKKLGKFSSRPFSGASMMKRQRGTVLS